MQRAVNAGGLKGIGVTAAAWLGEVSGVYAPREVAQRRLDDIGFLLESALLAWEPADESVRARPRPIPRTSSTSTASATASRGRDRRCLTPRVAAAGGRPPRRHPARVDSSFTMSVSAG